MVHIVLCSPLTVWPSNCYNKTPSYTPKHWGHQQGWWTSGQLPWPGGPEVQQQPHPPKTRKHLKSRCILSTRAMKFILQSVNNWHQAIYSNKDVKEIHKTFKSVSKDRPNCLGINWPLSVVTRVTQAYEEALNCQSPAAYPWSCLLGLDACSGSGGTDAHL